MEEFKMTFIRWKPVGDMVNIQDEINRIFESCNCGLESESGKNLMPRADIIEGKDSYKVMLDLPGIKKEDVKVTLQDNVLTVSGEKKKEDDSKDHTMHRVERSYGAFKRIFEMPVRVDSGKIKAEFKDGVLTIELLKTEESKPKEIAVEIN
jgi:HSP20 family protein